MRISAIVAVSKNNVIGRDGHMPWHLPRDLRYFKEMTTGHHIILGRKNYQDIGKPLANRVNLVLSRDPDFKAPGCIVCTSLDKAFSVAREAGETECFVTGGAHVYEQALPFCSRLYLTRLLADVEGDTFFPEFDDSFKLVSETLAEADEKNMFSCLFQLWER